jgi:hypothetical protein
VTSSGGSSHLSEGARRAGIGSRDGAYPPGGIRSDHRQAPSAHHVVGQGVPDRDVANLVDTTHHELPQTAGFLASRSAR